MLLRCRRLSCCAAGCPPQSAASLCARWRTLRGSVCIDAGDQHRPESDPLTACPRHPGPNFTGFRVQLGVSPTGPVQMNCVVPHDQRARRPSVNWFPLRTMTYNSSANLCSREAVTRYSRQFAGGPNCLDLTFRISSPLLQRGRKFGGDVYFCFSH